MRTPYTRRMVSHSCNGAAAFISRWQSRPLWIRPPDAQHCSQDADPRSKHAFSHRCCRLGSKIGDHKHRAKQQAAGQQLCGGRPGKGRRTTEYPVHQRKTPYTGYRHPHTDDPARAQIHHPDENQQCGGFPQAAVLITEEQRPQRGVQPGFGDRRSRRYGVRAHVAAQRLRQSNSSSARPAIAGLNRLRPIPPGSCLTTATAKTLASAAAQSAVPAGKDSPSSRPVTAPLPSKPPRPRSFRHSQSARTHTAVVVTRTAAACQRNSHTAHTHIGSSAITTSVMMADVVRFLRICGAAISCFIAKAHRFLSQSTAGKTAVPHDRQAGRQPRQPVLPAVLSFNRASRLIVSRRAPGRGFPPAPYLHARASGRLAGQVYEQQPQDIHCAACSASQTSRRPAITAASMANGWSLDGQTRAQPPAADAGLLGPARTPQQHQPGCGLGHWYVQPVEHPAGHRSAENGSQSSPPAPPQKASRSLSSVPTGAYTLPGCAT